MGETASLMYSVFSGQRADSAITPLTATREEPPPADLSGPTSRHQRCDSGVERRMRRVVGALIVLAILLFALSLDTRIRRCQYLQIPRLR